jgi:hypothetical protein
MLWERRVVVLGLIVEMLRGGFKVLGGVDDCSKGVWVVLEGGLFKKMTAMGEFCSGANGFSFDEFAML